MNRDTRPSSRPYVWLFFIIWLTVIFVLWPFGNWVAYFDRGQGPEIKFYIPWHYKLGVSAVNGFVIASFVTVLTRWIHLWLVSKPIAAE